MNLAPDYSAAYAILETDAGDGLAGHGMTFTIGRGNEVCARRSSPWRPSWSGGRSRRSRPTWARFWRIITGDSQLRWVGPEKGVIHLATAAVVNARLGSLGRRSRASRSGSCWPT